MGSGRIKLFFLFLLLTFLPLHAAPEVAFASSDVRKMMNQLFELHIEEKTMTAQLAERSLKIYINNFDPTYSYLLLEEIQGYLRPSSQLIQSVLSEYQQDRFTVFFTLDHVIKSGIVRARQWRQSWQGQPEKLAAEAEGVDLTSKKKAYCTSLQELQQHHYTQYLRLIASQMKNLGKSAYEGKENKLIWLCEKQLRQIENQYLGIDEKGELLSDKDQEHNVIMRTLKAMAHSLDAHTSFYSPEEAYALKVHLEKGMCGIGVVLRESIDGVIVSEILKGGPAEKCGKLKIGDTIVEVDGKPIHDFSFRHILEEMRGKEHTKLVLGVTRHKEQEKKPEYFRIELVRSKIALGDKRVDVQSEPYGDGIIGKITLHSFYEGENGVSSEKDIRKAIETLRRQGPLYGLILDMRENNGGFLSQAIRVSGLFISGGVVVISKYSDGEIKYYRSLNGSRFYDGPLVVLISKASASAAEIVAQALKDYGVAVIVGDEQSYGKGTIQHQTVTKETTEGFFKVTVGRYYTVSGKSTQIEGVKADVVIPTELCYEEVGESFLEFPLPPDQVKPAYEDDLSDIDALARKWFLKYYSPTVQSKQEIWNSKIPILSSNSKKRIVDNLNFQKFIHCLKGEQSEANYGLNDLQMEESVNILKDMILLQNAADKRAA